MAHLKCLIIATVFFVLATNFQDAFGAVAAKRSNLKGESRIIERDDSKSSDSKSVEVAAKRSNLKGESRIIERDDSKSSDSKSVEVDAKRSNLKGESRIIERDDSKSSDSKSVEIDDGERDLHGQPNIQLDALRRHLAGRLMEENKHINKRSWGKGKGKGKNSSSLEED